MEVKKLNTTEKKNAISVTYTSDHPDQSPDKAATMHCHSYR